MMTPNLVAVFVISFAVMSYGSLCNDYESNHIWRRLKNSSGSLVNKTKLLSEYSAVCPVHQHQCDSQCEEYPFILHNSTEFFFPCQTCSCHAPTCVPFQNCCPGVARGYLSYECVSTQKYPASNTPKSSTLMVTTCDNGSTTSLKTDCENLAYDVPVTSRLTAVTYRNQHCALCNNDTDFEPWELSVECQSSLDSSAIGSIEAFNQTLEKYSCRVLYQPESSELNIPCEQIQGHVNLINKCNVTGLWIQYDSDIEWACQNLVSSFREFKNVFCYVCNPSLASKQQRPHISECNVTGWNRYLDPEVERGCLTQPLSERFAPYRNVFCLICNGGHLDKGFWTNAYSFEFTTKEDFVPFNNISKVILTLITYGDSLESSMQIIRSALRDVVTTDYVMYEIDNRDEYVSDSQTYMDSLLRHYDSVCGTNVTCGHNITMVMPLWPPCEWCSCNTDCIGSFDCCPEVLLQTRPYSSLRHKEPHGTRVTPRSDSSHNLLVISTCFRHTVSDWLKEKCENTTSDQSDVFSSIPVGSPDVLPFRNIYCWYCNSEYGALEIRLSATCNTYVELSLFVDMWDLLRLLVANCRVRFILPTPIFLDDERQTTDPEPSTRPAVNVWKQSKRFFDQCNMTGNWIPGHTNDAYDIITACHNPSIGLPNLQVGRSRYRNVFCFICNPEQPRSSTTVEKCNVTGSMTYYEASLELQCETQPSYTRWTPYKNLYCHMCNVQRMYGTYNNDSVVTIESMWNGGSNYRKIFSLDPKTWHLFQGPEEPRPECDNGTYDVIRKSCRELYCSKGRILKDGACVTFIPKVNDLHYSLAMVLRVVKPPVQSGDLYYLYDLCQAIKSDIIESNYNNSVFQFINCMLVANERCLYDIFGQIGIRVKVNYVISVTLFMTVSTTDRDRLEKNLVKATEKVYRTFTVENRTVWFQRCRSGINDSGLDESCDVFGKPSDDFCYFTDVGMSFIGSAIPGSLSKDNRIVFVTKLLVCPQVKLEADEYVNGNRTDEIKLVRNSRILTVDEYMHFGNSSVLVCRDDYIQTKTAGQGAFKRLPLLNLIHSLFSLSCTSLSVLCLLATFITYSIFPSLRTLPGKNNMNLVACLILAQSSLQIGFYETDEIPCMFLGMLIHFSWMASFCAMNVCSFHMFRVFCSRPLSLPSSSSDRKTFARYTLYIIVLPASLVAIIVTVFLVQTNGSDTGYGHDFCFISNYFAVAFAFIAPAIVLFISNIVFFVITFHKIRTSPSVQNTAGDRRELGLYVKLCTLTGISWPLMIIDATLDVSVFSFFATLVNALQGLFIFVAYVCNRRVFNLFTRKTRQLSRESNTASSTTSKASMSPEMSEISDTRSVESELNDRK